VTVSAGSAIYVAHQHAHDVAAKMVRGLRLIGAFMMAIPALVAGGLVYMGKSGAAQTWQPEYILALWALVAGAALCCLTVLSAWLTALRSQRNDRASSSWDQTDVETSLSPTAAAESHTYREAMEEFGFDSPAIGFYTAEGWHERYDWDDAKQKKAIEDLGSGSTNLSRCRCSSEAHTAPERLANAKLRGQASETR
jgi:YD repeat-containing protein